MNDRSQAIGEELLSQSHPEAAAPRSSRPLRIEAAGATDTGRLRARNEDAFAVLPELGLFIVTDGMGGCAAGEIAAQMAIDVVRESLQDPDATWPPGAQAPPGPGLPSLVDAVQRANGRIFAVAQRDSARRGMGTTIAAALAFGGRAAIAHVGDSRIYRLRGGRLDLLTEDHTFLNECIRAGVVDPADAASFPYHGHITRALGPEEAVDVDARLLEPAAGDVLLLCSDGLSGVVEDREIAGILVEHHDLERAAERLIARGNDNGGPDNITCVLVRWIELQR
jgi:protein phosphatase